MDYYAISDQRRENENSANAHSAYLDSSNGALAQRQRFDELAGSGSVYGGAEYHPMYPDVQMHVHAHSHVPSSPMMDDDSAFSAAYYPSAQASTPSWSPSSAARAGGVNMYTGTNSASSATQYFGYAGTEHVDPRPHAAQIPPSASVSLASEAHSTRAHTHVPLLIDAEPAALSSPASAERYAPAPALAQNAHMNMNMGMNMNASMGMNVDVPLYAPVPLNAYPALLSSSANARSVSQHAFGHLAHASGPASMMGQLPISAHARRAKDARAYDADMDADARSAPNGLMNVGAGPSWGFGRDPAPASSQVQVKREMESERETKQESENPLDLYLNAPQVMFPTPCELLTDAIAKRTGTSTGTDARAESSGSRTRAQGALNDDATQRKSSPSSSSAAHPDSASSVLPSSPLSPSSPSSSPSRIPRAGSASDRAVDHASSSSKTQGRKPKHPVKHTENQRKTYFRAVAQSIGFTPTDPYVVVFPLRALPVSDLSGFVFWGRGWCFMCVWGVQRHHLVSR